MMICMYVYVHKCYTRNANIKHDTAQYWPDPKAIIEHYQVHYNSDLSFTSYHRICNICCNIYSTIMKRVQSLISSLNEKLQHLLLNDDLLLPEGEEYGH